MVSRTRKPTVGSKNSLYRAASKENLVPNYIKQWRLFRGFESQTALAKASGLRAGDINRLESGKIAWTRQNLVPLAKALHCHEGDLISRDPFKLEADIFRIMEKMSASDRKTFEESGWWPFLR